MNQSAFVFAGNDAFERALFGDAEDDDVEFAFAAEGEGGRVHDFEVFVQGFVKGDGFVACGGRVFFRVCGINAVHISGFEHDVAVHFGSAQGGGGVGGEERVARTGGEDDDFAFFKVLDGFGAGVGFGDLLHGLYDVAQLWMGIFQASWRMLLN